MSCRTLVWFQSLSPNLHNANQTRAFITILYVASHFVISAQITVSVCINAGNCEGLRAPTPCLVSGLFPWGWCFLTLTVHISAFYCFLHHWISDCVWRLFGWIQTKLKSCSSTTLPNHHPLPVLGGSFICLITIGVGQSFFFIKFLE
jgi:hypothetical protein